MDYSLVFALMFLKLFQNSVSQSDHDFGAHYTAHNIHVITTLKPDVDYYSSSEYGKKRESRQLMAFTTRDFYKEGFRQNCDHIFKSSHYLDLNSTDEQRLMCHLLHEYNPLVRPVPYVNSTLRVNFSLSVNQIFDLNDKEQLLKLNVWFEQSWLDFGLKWDPNEFGGLREVKIPSDYIFLPDIVLYNNAAGYGKPKLHFRALVKHDGLVFHGRPAKLSSTCHVDPTIFPFDMQVCRLKFGSWTFTGDEIDLQPSRSSVDLSRYITHGKWELVDVIQKRSAVIYSCCPEKYIDISYYIVLKRRPLFYLLNVFFFTFILALMVITSYQLPTKSGEKCALGSAVLFSVSVFMLSRGNTLSESSEYVPMINAYLFIIMGMTASSLTMIIVVHNVHFQKIQTPPDGGYPRIKRLPKVLRGILKMTRRADGETQKTIDMNFKKFERKKHAIKKLRKYRQNMITAFKDNQPQYNTHRFRAKSYSRSFPFTSLRKKQVEFTDSTCMPVCPAHVKTISFIITATDHLIDKYDAELISEINLMEWHELATFVDKILFWSFLFFSVAVVTFVFVVADHSLPTVDEILAKFSQRNKMENS